MKIVNAKDITGSDHDVNWGNGTSRRMLVEADGMGYSVHYTVTFRGTSSTLSRSTSLLVLARPVRLVWMQLGATSRKPRM